MRMRSLARRSGVPIPFLAVAFLVLTRFSGPAATVPHRTASRLAPFVIVTTPNLRPAFEALETWNEEQGCRVAVVSLPSDATPEHAEDLVAYMGAICSLRGTVGLVLGGDRRTVPGLAGTVETAPVALYENLLSLAAFPPRWSPIPVPPAPMFPSGLRVGRVPVETPSEAWAFVDACRASGLTLDLLLEETVDRPGAVENSALSLLEASSAFPGTGFPMRAAPSP